MGDISIVFDNDQGIGDFLMSGPTLLTGKELETAVNISLFTDKTADVGDPVMGDPDPRGWWADTYSQSEDNTLPVIGNDRIGSKLWMLFNLPRNQQTLNWMHNEINLALNWMLVDGVASLVDNDTFFTGKGGVGAFVFVTSNGVPYRWKYAWDQER